MNGMRKSHDAFATSSRGSPTLPGSSLRLRVAMNVHQGKATQELRRKMRNRYLTFLLSEIDDPDLPELTHWQVVIRGRASSCDFL